MTVDLVNRNDGKWHWEITPENELETQFALAVSPKTLKARFLGSLLIVEVDTPSK